MIRHINFIFILFVVLAVITCLISCTDLHPTNISSLQRGDTAFLEDSLFYEVRRGSEIDTVKLVKLERIVGAEEDAAPDQSWYYQFIYCKYETIDSSIIWPIKEQQYYVGSQINSGVHAKLLFGESLTITLWATDAMSINTTDSAWRKALFNHQVDFTKKRGFSSLQSDSLRITQIK